MANFVMINIYAFSGALSALLLLSTRLDIFLFRDTTIPVA